MSNMKPCKYCQELIVIRKINGKWRPADPHTGLRHECEKEIVCKGCGHTFVGAPYKTLCSNCWKADNLDKNRFSRRYN